MLCNEGTAAHIVDAGLVEMLFQHMGDKKTDDEFVLQLTFTFAKLLAHAPTRRRLLENTQIVHYLVDLLTDGNKEVCSKTLSATCTLRQCAVERSTTAALTLALPACVLCQARRIIFSLLDVPSELYAIAVLCAGAQTRRPLARNPGRH